MKKKNLPVASLGAVIFAQLNSNHKSDNHSHPQLEKRDASRLSRNSPVQGREKCPHCGSGNLKIGAGLKPGEESRRCNDCKHFLGYSPLRKLKKARKRQELTNCLEILENQGIRGDLAIFILSLAADGSEVDV